MLQLEQALARILEAIPAAQPESISVEKAHGRVLLEKLIAPIDLPCFDNSAMDGYAVRAADLSSASADFPVRLRLLERVVAGRRPTRAILPGTCSRIFTGSPIPAGADAVVMQESTRLPEHSTEEVLFQEAVERGENIRLRGEDIPRGRLLLAAGNRISAPHMTVLGAVGRSRVTVGAPPAVGLLATGSELQEPGTDLRPGCIYESNRLGLQALLQDAGAVCKVYPIVTDEPEATRKSLAVCLQENDILVSSGGVSVGEMDFVKPAFEAEGGCLEFWRVNIKPGRPFVFGRRGGKFLFGLPGNPLSAMVTCLLLVRPAVLRWQGAIQCELPSHPAVLGASVGNDGPRPHFVRVRVDPNGEVHPVGLQASHGLGALALANGLLEVPAGASWETGREVRVLRWEWS